MNNERVFFEHFDFFTFWFLFYYLDFVFIPLCTDILFYFIYFFLYFLDWLRSRRRFSWFHCSPLKQENMRLCVSFFFFWGTERSGAASGITSSICSAVPWSADEWMDGWKDGGRRSLWSRWLGALISDHRYSRCCFSAHSKRLILHPLPSFLSLGVFLPERPYPSPTSTPHLLSLCPHLLSAGLTSLSSTCGILSLAHTLPFFFLSLTFS